MSSREPIHDYAKSRAVLIGISDYAHLPPVPPALNSLDRMERLLRSGLCGWPKDRITVIRNERNPGDLPDKLITTFEEAQDIAFFYFVGHGQIDIDDELCLGLTGSRTEAHRRAATSLQFQAVRRAMLGSSAKTKIIVLDCCFAGLANRPNNTLGTADLLDRASGAGAYTMAACGSYATAWFEDGPQKYAQTFFSKYLADTVEAGIAGEAPVIRLRSLFGRVREKLAADGRPLPEDRNVDSAGEFPFAHNAAPAPVPSGDLPQANALTGDELGNLKAILTNLSRRNDTLIHRQRVLIDSLERAEVDPDRLENLYRLDHLATRMRRNSENLLVLAGHEPGNRRMPRLVPLGDVVRAAASEIEQYERVSLRVPDGIQVVGEAASDVVHLVAEILENATVFSRKDTRVELTGERLASGGVLLVVTDSGIGMSEQEMVHHNWRLDNPQELDVSVSRRMGLFVVARLAARCGVRVRLQHATPSGLTALIWLPDSVVPQESGQPRKPTEQPDSVALPGFSPSQEPDAGR